MVEVPLDDRRRPRHGLDPRRPRGDHRRVDVRRPQGRRDGRHLQLHIGLAGALYVAGAGVGALFFGQLTDRLGRKKLFLITLAVYTCATVATAFAPTALWYFVCRTITGAGIGGEYAAINSAIDELIPKKFRGLHPSRSTAPSGSARPLVRCSPSRSSTPPWSPPSTAGDSPSASARSWPRHLRRPAARPGVSALALHPRPGGRGRPDRQGHREARRGGRGPGPPRDRGRQHHGPAAQDDQPGAHRQDRLHALPQAHRALPQPLHRPGGSSTTRSSLPTATRCRRSWASTRPATTSRLSR